MTTVDSCECMTCKNCKNQKDEQMNKKRWKTRCSLYVLALHEEIFKRKSIKDKLLFRS